MQSKSTTSDYRPTVAIPEIVLSLVDHLDAMLAYWDINQVCGFANRSLSVK